MSADHVHDPHAEWHECVKYKQTALSREQWSAHIANDLTQQYVYIFAIAYYYYDYSDLMNEMLEFTSNALFITTTILLYNYY